MLWWWRRVSTGFNSHTLTHAVCSSSLKQQTSYPQTQTTCWEQPCKGSVPLPSFWCCFLNQKVITRHAHPKYNSHWQSCLVRFSLSPDRPEVLCGEVCAYHNEKHLRVAISLAVFPFMSKWGQKTIWSLETKPLATDQDIPQNIPSPPFRPSLSLSFFLFFSVNKLIQL